MNIHGSIKTQDSTKLFIRYHHFSCTNENTAKLPTIFIVMRVAFMFGDKLSPRKKSVKFQLVVNRLIEAR